ncbi:MAG: hypothetical protein ISS19_10420 [Bacteroidales bacterium]|nr:hypothetical protein [Bacteroidales bacterium]
MNISLILAYIVVSSVCISLFYLFYRLLLQKDTDFRAVRIYLIASIIISFILPSVNMQVNLDLPSLGTSEYFAWQHDKIDGSEAGNTEASPVITNPSESQSSGPVRGNAEIIAPPVNLPAVPSSGENIPWSGIVLLVYLLGFAFLMVRLLKQFTVISVCYFRSEKEKSQSFIIIRNTSFDHPFSFFNWIFIPAKITPDNEMSDIIQHEKIHARQWHSADMLLTEALTAIMWFNPLIWMMRDSVQLVHEYLADEGALNKGLDKVFYQALLVNQVAEGRLIPLSSRFNQSLIKKRITMMSKTKSNQMSKLKLLGVLPIIALLVLGIACAKTQEKQVLSEVNGEMTNDDVITAIVPIKMNVLYIGVENPVAVAVSGYKSEELEVRLNNGRIEGQAGEYVVMPARTGEAEITVSKDGRDVGSITFRVKPIPDPVARVGEMRSGSISKSDLLEAGGINAYMAIDFDIQFKVVSFVMSATVPMSGAMAIREEISKSDKYSELQIDLINSLITNQKLMVEEIKAIGPDGAIRDLGPMVFTISE